MFSILHDLFDTDQPPKEGDQIIRTVIRLTHRKEVDPLIRDFMVWVFRVVFLTVILSVWFKLFITALQLLERR